MCHTVALLFFFIFAISGEMKLPELLFFALFGELSTHTIDSASKILWFSAKNSCGEDKQLLDQTISLLRIVQ